ncbi:MAG: peptidylprolyl isomerase [Planctomycetota bacterium]|nr:peptidylprolyl isomerase [Planctomycetota bacterium]
MRRELFLQRAVRARRTGRGLIAVEALAGFLALAVGASLDVTRRFWPAGADVELAARFWPGLPGERTIALLDAADGETIAEMDVPAGPFADVPVRLSRVTEGGATLWEMAGERWPRALVLQARAGGRPVGTPLILEVLREPPRLSDAWSARLWRAVESGDQAAARSLLELPAGARRELREAVDDAPPPAELAGPLGVLVHRDHRLIMRTTAGEMTLALRWDAAPRTCAHVLSLAQLGVYEGVTFHRILAEDAQGRPFFVQTGDPTGTGLGGCGWRIDFERSSLEHEFGVVSLARLPSDVNSGSSQLIMCLSREACAGLDGVYASFAVVERGGGVLRRVARGTAGGDEASDPPTVRSVSVVPAPPYVSPPVADVPLRLAPRGRIAR